MQTATALVQKYIETNPNVLLGKPVIVGTRITVELILEKLAADESFEEILAEHPRLRREHILAALAFVAQSLKGEMIIHTIPSEFNNSQREYAHSLKDVIATHPASAA